MVEKEKEVKVDDDLYSRSIFTYGMETMKKLSTMKVLIVGMRGLGVETAKNIILSGPGEVDIFDPSLVKINDLGSNFYLSEEDVGKKNRDDASVGKLSKLNPYVKVSVLKIEQKADMNEYTNEYTNEFCNKLVELYGENDGKNIASNIFNKLEEYNVVVFTELQPMFFIAQVDVVCRNKNIKLIYGFCFGLVGYIFTDFGMNHVIFDETGEEIETYLVKSISKDKDWLIYGNRNL